ncbi:protein of unknown function [Xenorhabdus doucetiae]|uniref:Uncharacterized protein n=1 Tax=Xenorhabdus doucetiae TaxID=351671 RepID=A0A068QUJ9_9GAMM|nr:protein of unknown function [Xenorhabdus doucetiae]
MGYRKDIEVFLGENVIYLTKFSVLNKYKNILRADYSALNK